MSTCDRCPTSVYAGQARCHIGGAEGIRTPDLLIANETRYQLRHSPKLTSYDASRKDITGCVRSRIRSRLARGW